MREPTMAPLLIPLLIWPGRKVGAARRAKHRASDALRARL